MIRRLRVGSKKEEIVKPKSTRLAGMKVIAVDDNRINQLVLSQALKSTGADLECYFRAAEAIERLEPGASSFFLLDVIMPDMDGLTATAKIREWETANEQPHRPVLLLTAQYVCNRRDEFLACGADGLLEKPFSAGDLIAQMEALLPVEQVAIGR